MLVAPFSRRPAAGAALVLPVLLTLAAHDPRPLAAQQPQGRGAITAASVTPA